MSRFVKLANNIRPTIYDRVIALYKHLIKKGDKDKLYFFKAVVYCCLNPSKEGGWRDPDDFLGEITRVHWDRDTQSYSLYVNFDHSYQKYKDGKGKWFGIPITDAIKRIL